MLEKYTTYQRSHILNLDKRSFQGSCPDKKFQAMINQFPEKIRTTEIEKQLLAFAKDLGIKIEYKHVEDCKTIAEEYSAYPTVIAADGARSIVRKQIFQEELDTNKDLKYIAEVKYEVEGSTRRLNRWKEAIPTLTYAHHLISENVGKEKEGKSPVSVQFFIDKATFDTMQEARGKTFYRFTDEAKINHDLMRSMDVWLNARKMIANEKRIVGSERITVTNLSVYSSKNVVTEKLNKKWFLVGDAAFGVPFFRSLNNGLICGNELAKVMSCSSRA